MQNVTNATNFSATVHTIKQNHIEGPLGKEISAAAHEKNAVRKTEASSEDVSISTGTKPMELLYKAVIESVNEVLEENAIQVSIALEADASPEATAEKIVSTSTALFTSYLEQHPDLSTEEAASSFVEIIKNGINKGFADAREILDGLNTLDENTSTNIDTTYDLSQQGLLSFLDSHV